MANVKYLFKIDSKLKLLPAAKIAGLSYNEIVILAAAALEEQRRQLILDAKYGDKFYYGRKVVDALEISINKLEERFPNLREQVHKLVFGELNLN